MVGVGDVGVGEVGIGVEYEVVGGELGGGGVFVVEIDGDGGLVGVVFEDFGDVDGYGGGVFCYCVGMLVVVVGECIDIIDMDFGVGKM